jgi:hypothetical protein
MCNYLDATLIQVAPELWDARRLACLYCGDLDQKCKLLEALNECMKKKMLAMGVPQLIYVPCVELRCAIGLLGLPHQRTKAIHSFRRHGHDGSPSLLPHHAERVDVVDMWARSPLIVSRVLHGLDGQKVKAPTTPCIISGVGSKRPLQFSLWHK